MRYRHAVRLRQQLVRQCQAGFSLIELAIALAAFAVLMALALPEMAAWAAASELASFSNVLVTGMNLARSEAIKRNVRVTMCKSADGHACSTVGGWEQGLIVFQDGNQNGVRDVGEPLLRRQQPMPATWVASGNSPVRNYVSYDPVGQSRLANGGFQAGTITVCQRSGGPVDARQIMVNNVGRPRSQKTTVASCP